jgi:hypothetical protein
MKIRKRLIPAAVPGDDLKFRVTVDREDFSIYEDDFVILVRDQGGRTRWRITKDDCFWDTEGRWYFTLERVRTGMYFAFFKGSYEDEDYDKQRRVWNDRQELMEVGLGRTGHDTVAVMSHCGHSVHYEQVWSVSVDGADYLADCYGRYIYTSDGKRIMFTSKTSEKIDDMGKVKMNMTGEEFLRLVEGKEPNEEVNTIPELMDAMRGISDDKTVIQEIEEKQDENEAGDSDIDEIFDDEPDFPDDEPTDVGQGGGMDEEFDDD